ncbi:M20 family metallopeptidase [Roseitranquillus sediminis]|uniref:M20 family metallopeptidase n=1 Tax=Roseitranquillus sediminis TaxID=2809051 RepID=UPI001D0C7A12|nr:M20 family metallopeptidase [Roseitranquillus sediminis]MBM9594762.1 M20 family metallopeptidase [Roseitranquillus sediminis]
MTKTAAELLNGIRGWVEIESHTPDLEGLARLADRVTQEYEAFGAEVERVTGRDGYGDHLVVRAPWARRENVPGILILSHIDTVHPRGTIRKMPFRLEGDVAYGPGIYDMKGGAYIAMDAVAAVAANGGAPLPVTHLFVSDEEVGSPTSRDLIESLARGARYVLVTEPAREGGRIVTARKGTMRYTVRTFGRPSHSGTRHQDGRSAIAEIARIALKFHALTDYDRGITCNVGEIGGGTGVNVVPAEAWAAIDVRVPDAAATAEIEAFVASLEPEEPEVTIEVEGGLNRPAYEASAGGTALFEHARKRAAELGFELEGLKTGGGSDGNFTATLAPTLDGLGVDGQGAHTLHEQLYVSSLEPRRDLLRRLIETLE